MEKEIEAMRGNIEALKTKPKEKKEKKKKDKAPVASTSKASSKPVKASSKKKGKKPVSDDDVLTFEQKKDLSESIGRLDDSKLEKVIQIIHEGVPEIRDVSIGNTHLLFIPEHIHRAPKKLSWKLTCFPLRSSRSSTTLSFGQRASLHLQSAVARVKARAQVG